MSYGPLFLLVVVALSIVAICIATVLEGRDR